MGRLLDALLSGGGCFFSLVLLAVTGLWLWFMFELIASWL